MRVGRISFIFIYLFGVLRRFQHCTGHITTGSWKGRGNQYIEFVRVVYCKLPTNGKQLPAFPLKAVTGIEPGEFHGLECNKIILKVIGSIFHENCEFTFIKWINT